MKLRWVLVAVVVVVMSAVGVAAATASGGPVNFQASLSGFNEVPAIVTTGSGSFTARRVSDGVYDFELKYSGLEENPLFAHIHVGQEGVNGSVVVFLCGGGGTPACPAATSGTVTGTITAASVIGVASQGISAGDLDDVFAAIDAGVAYVNIHTPSSPAGRVRGQIKPGN